MVSYADRQRLAGHRLTGEGASGLSLPRSSLGPVSFVVVVVLYGRKPDCPSSPTIG